MAELETVTMRGWPKGLNLAADPTVVGADELLEATNVAYGPLGEIGIRKGAIVSGVLGGTPNAGPQDWIWSWWPAEAEEPQLVMVSRSAEEIHWTDLEGTALDTPVGLGTWQANNEYMWFPQAVVMLNKAYVSVPSDDPTAFSLESDTLGDTLTELDPWDGQNNTTTDFPSAGALLIAYERVFAANVMFDALGKTVDRLFFSEALSPLEWKTNNFIDIGPDQGQAITALRYFADQIIIFKEASVWGILGSNFVDIGDNQLYMIDGGYGCTAPGTIVEAGNGLLFLDPARGVILYDGSQFHDIGQNVFRAIQAALTPENEEDPIEAHKCWAWMHENVYYLSIPDHGVYAFDIRIGAWSFHTWQPHCTTSFVMGGRSVVMGVADAPDGDGYVWDMHLGGVDINGLLVEMSAHTAWISPGTSALQHRLHATDVTYYADDRILNLHFHVDFDDAEAGTASFATSTGHKMVRTHAGPGARWRAIQLHIKSESEES